MKKLITFIIIFSVLFLPSLTMAQGLGQADDVIKDIAGRAGVGTGDSVSDIVGLGLNVALSLVGTIFLVLMVYAGYLWMTARGEEEQVKKAQKIIMTTMIGIVIILGAYAITKLITGGLANF